MTDEVLETGWHPRKFPKESKDGIIQLLCPPPPLSMFNKVEFEGGLQPVRADVKFCAQLSFQVVSGM